MSAPGEAKDDRASRAKPRLEERVCERGWRPTRDGFVRLTSARRALRGPRRRAIRPGPTRNVSIDSTASRRPR